MATPGTSAFLSISERGMVLERGYLNVADNIVYIAGDPGDSGAVAAQVGGNSPVTFAITNKQLPDDLIHHLSVLRDAGYHARIAIERQGRAPARFRAHNADANTLAVALRKQFPRRHKTVFIKPQAWQKALGVCKPENADKNGNAGRMCYDEYSIRYLGGMPSDTEDEHAARCILHYSLISGVLA